jgi:AAA+ superfamily predicted ATPase
MAPNRTHALRSDEVFAALDRAAADGTTVVFEGNTSDFFVIDGSFTRLPHLLALWSARRDMPTFTYTMAEGTKHLVAPDGPRSHVKEAKPDLDRGYAADVTGLLKGIVGGKQPTTLVLDFAETMLPGPSDGAGRSLDEATLLEEVLSQPLDARTGWAEGGHRLVLIGRTGGLPSCVTEMPGVVGHSLGLPDAAEREAAIQLMLDSPRHRLALEPALDRATVARLSGGMSLDALSRLRYASSEAQPLTREQIIAEKSATIRKMAGATLTVFEEDRDMDDVAGLPQVRLYLEDQQLTGRNTIRLILAGSPGNGKTLVALAIARLLGVPAVALNQIKDMWVGNSEKALGKALEVIKSMAPVLVIADEFDQTMGGSRASSSAMESSAVESSLRAMFMEFTGDHATDNGISIVGMSNNPQGIDAAFMSRFKTIAVLEPSSPGEMVEVVQKNTAKAGASIDAEGLARAFADCAQTYSGRELVNLLIAAHVYAVRGGTNVVGYQEMTQALRESQHYSTRREQRQALSAVAFTHSHRYLPWNAATVMGDTTVVPPVYLQKYVRADGSLDMEAITAQLEGDPSGF